MTDLLDQILHFDPITIVIRESIKVIEIGLIFF